MADVKKLIESLEKLSGKKVVLKEESKRQYIGRLVNRFIKGDNLNLSPEQRNEFIDNVLDDYQDSVFEELLDITTQDLSEIYESMRIGGFHPEAIRENKKALKEAKYPVLLSTFVGEMQAYLKDNPNSVKIARLIPQLQDVIAKKGDMEFDLNAFKKRFNITLEEGFAVQTLSPKQGQDPMF